MSLITNHTRRVAYPSPALQLEVDVARHLWSSSRAHRATDVSDPEFSFKLGLTCFKTDVFRIDGDALPNRINYRVTDDGYAFVLSPLLFNNSFDVKLRNIKMNLPDKIRAECFCINQFNTPQGEPAIIIDAITETGMLITLIIKVLDFVVNGGSKLTSASYQDWAKISQPYGFEVRIPHMLYSFAHDYLVVLLRDGGIIGLQRDVQFDIEPIIFNDNSYLESLGQFFRPWANKTTFNGERDLSLKTVIDVVRFQDFLFTVTINRHLRIWSISKQSLILEKDLADFLTTPNANNREYLDSTPSKLLDIFTVESTHYLTVYLPFGNGVFKMFSLQETNFDIIELKDHEFVANLPDSNSIWLVGDFQLTKQHNDLLQLWVLWKSNTSSFIQQLQLDSSSKSQWFAVHDSTSSFDRLEGECSSEFYLRKIFQSGIYSKQVIATALPIFEKHFHGEKSNDIRVVSDDVSLFERVTKSISRGIEMGPTYESTIETQFLRFDTLCSEFKKQADEPLKFYLDGLSGMLLVINRDEYSFVRPSSTLEMLGFNKPMKVDSVATLTNVGDHLRFLNIISDFKSSLSSDVFASVKGEVFRVFSNPERDTDALLNLIFDRRLKDKFNPVNLGKLVEELSQFNNIFTLIDDVLNYQMPEVESVRMMESRLTSLSSTIITETCKDIVGVNSDILFSILMLLLVLNFDDKKLLDSVSKRVVKLIVSYEIFRESMQVSFNSNDTLELDDPTISSRTLFTKVLEVKFPFGFPITKSSVVQFVTHQVVPFIQTDEFMYQICTLLMKRELSSVVYERFLKFFDDKSVFRLLKALVFLKTGQPEKAAKYMARYAEEISKHTLTVAEKAIFQQLEEVNVFFGTNLGKYYLNVAILFLNNLNFDQAEKFMVLLGDKRVGEGFERKYHDEEAYTYFTISVEKLDLVNANRTLQWIRNEKLRSEALNKMLHVMYKNQSIHKLGELSTLKEDPAVDALILRKAQTDDVKRSLWFYQVLYAHRLNRGDFRGACEALYDFIKQNETGADETMKVAAAELYSVILNVVGTLAPDDQWIIKHGEEEDVVSLEQLHEEKHVLVSAMSRESRARDED